MAKMDAAFVWGDRDRDRMGLLRHARQVNVVCFGVLGELDLDGKRAVLVHGDDKKLVRRLLDEQQYDYLFCGHDPGGEDRKVGRTRVINPGELQGGPSQNCAVVSTTSDEVKFFTAGGSAPSAPLFPQFERKSNRSAKAGPYRRYSPNRRTMIVSFCPPKPKLLLMATSTLALRAALGT